MKLTMILLPSVRDGFFHVSVAGLSAIAALFPIAAAIVRDSFEQGIATRVTVLTTSGHLRASQ